MEMELFNISNVKDAIRARQTGRVLARELGFGIIDQTRIAYAISELSNCFVEMHQRSQLLIGEVRKDTGEAGLEWSLIGSCSFSHELEEEWKSLWSEEWDIAITRRVGTCITFRKWLPPSYYMNSTPIQLQLFATGEEQG
ncbi:serine/threonine-protein kinase RsbT [Paenibacillaceae bacterium GAS479]|nr:serine/threonine-protein kinase RsbT [Paenibacillaceae bacterium GAS479]